MPFLPHPFNSAERATSLGPPPFGVILSGKKNLYAQLRITLAGTPAAKQCDGMSFVTTELAPITTSSPMVTPPTIVHLVPTQTLLPSTMGPVQKGRSRNGTSDHSGPKQWVMSWIEDPSAIPQSCPIVIDSMQDMETSRFTMTFGPMSSFPWIENVRRPTKMT